MATTLKSEVTQNVCWKCHLVCKSKSGLTKHQNICTKLEKGESFLKNEIGKRATRRKSDHEKILPLSQPLTPFDDALAMATMAIREENNVTSQKKNKDVKIPQTNTVEDGKHGQSQRARRDDTEAALDNSQEEKNCPVCKIDVVDMEICCNNCNVWYHFQCLHMTKEEPPNNVNWICSMCQHTKASNLKWGAIQGEENIKTVLRECYKEIISWRKNIMPLPRGKSGEHFIEEVTKLINLFVDKTAWQRLALLAVHVFIPIMLQKPSARSKPRDHSKYLSARLNKWNGGDIKAIMKENKEIQKRLQKSHEKKEESRDRAFVRNMLLGKIGPAAKYINNEDAVKGVHNMNEEIKAILQSKHPEAKASDPSALLQQSQNDGETENVIYEEIDAELVRRTANVMKGSGGPTQIDSDMWKDFTGAKALGKAPEKLCQAIADAAKLLCTEEVHPTCLEEYNACRLIPLDKGITKDGTPGVRPIGVGEVLRRLIGKLLIRVIKKDITTAAGPLQTCSGLKAGIEAAIHAMRSKFEDEKTECILLVDAENAFNNLNRKTALENIRKMCPPFYRYLNNTYQKPAQLIINDQKKVEIIASNEGCTQGDVTAMALYALGIKPLIDHLANSTDKEDCAQCWFADDSSAGGKLTEIKRWWDELQTEGPKYGYFPLPKKTVLIVKDAHKHQAMDIFQGTDVTISATGERHMGACVGSSEHKEIYVKNKISKWIEDVEELARLAKDEPQAVYSCYTKAISHRWSYVQRTIPGISHLFNPLEDAIREKLMSSLVARKTNDRERKIFAFLRSSSLKTWLRS